LIAIGISQALDWQEPCLLCAPSPRWRSEFQIANFKFQISYLRFDICQPEGHAFVTEGFCTSIAALARIIRAGVNLNAFQLPVHGTRKPMALFTAGKVFQILSHACETSRSENPVAEKLSGKSIQFASGG
jgi:hypothetical protein